MLSLDDGKVKVMKSDYNQWQQVETSRTWGQFEPQSFPFPWPQQPPIYHLQTIVKVKACTLISALWLWSPPHQGPSKLSPFQPAHSSLDRTGHFSLRQEHSGRDFHLIPFLQIDYMWPNYWRVKQGRRKRGPAVAPCFLPGPLRPPETSCRSTNHPAKSFQPCKCKDVSNSSKCTGLEDSGRDQVLITKPANPKKCWTD